MSKGVGIAIKHIKEISFLVDEEKYEKDRLLNMSLQQRMGYDLNARMIDITIKMQYSYDEQTPVAETQVRNIFEVESMEGLISNKQLNLPDPVLATLLTLSVTHTRAIMSKNLSGTFYQNVIFPITSVDTLVAHFFPERIGKQD